MQTMLVYMHDYNRLNFFDLCLIYLINKSHKTQSDYSWIMYLLLRHKPLFSFLFFSDTLTYLIYDSSTVQSTQMSS